jgi:hypothetical protein
MISEKEKLSMTNASETSENESSVVHIKDTNKFKLLMNM